MFRSHVAAFYSVYGLKSNATPNPQVFNDFLFELFVFASSHELCRTSNLLLGEI